MKDFAQAVQGWANYLDRTQWYKLKDLEKIQEQGLKRLVLHHAVQSPWFKRWIAEQGLQPRDIFTLEGLKKLKTFTKRDIQNAGEDFFARSVPDVHKPVRDISTSGSTGQPVTTKKTQMDQVIWNAMTVRDHSWWGRSAEGQKLTAIKAGIKIQVEHAQWGMPMSMFHTTGASQGLPVWMKTEEQLAAVEQFQPDIMILHAGVLRGFVTIWERKGYTLTNLKHCRNISDTVDQDLRDRFRALSGLEIEDNYSCSETGSVAMQCPVSGLYHTMMETQIVEVIDRAGNPCQEGQEGRIVITDLYNTANPIIRYEIGDWAIVGGECGCGRAHKTFSKVLGRERNLFKLPDGSRFWPRAGRYAMQQVANVRQWQIVQHAYDDVEFKIVTDEAITEEQETKLKEIFSEAINNFAPVRITRYSDSIPPNKGGKFEESVCLVE